MSQLQTKRTTAHLAYTFQFAQLVPAGATVSAIAHTAPTGLTLEDETVDLDEKTSTVLVSGGAHGRTYEVIAIATLSNNEQVPQSFTLTVLDG